MLKVVIFSLFIICALAQQVKPIPVTQIPLGTQPSYDPKPIPPIYEIPYNYPIDEPGKPGYGYGIPIEGTYYYFPMDCDGTTYYYIPLLPIILAFFVGVLVTCCCCRRKTKTQIIYQPLNYEHVYPLGNFATQV